MQTGSEMMQSTRINMKKEVKSIEEAGLLVESLYRESKYIIDAKTLPTGSIEISWQEHKTYKALDGKEWPDEVWRTEDGRVLQIQDIDPEHCRNILRMILRQEREMAARMQDLAAKMKAAIEAIREDTAGYEDPIDGSFVPESKPVVHWLKEIMTTALAEKNILKRDNDDRWYSIPPNMVDSFIQAVEEISLAEWGSDEWGEACDDLDNRFGEYRIEE